MSTFRTALAHPLLAAVIGILVTAFLGISGVWLCVEVAGDYGYALCLVLPALLGFVPAFLACENGPRSFRRCLAASALAFLLVLLLLLALGVEGLLCILMALPLWLPLGGAGCIAGWAAGRILFPPDPLHARGFPVIPLLLLLGFLPLSLGAEHTANLQPPILSVTTTFDIDAPPDIVWPYVAAQPDLPPPTEWLFRAGVAYPVRTTIAGAGLGAARACVLSTGPIEETVTVWNPGRQLEFSVQKTPAPMHEWSPYSHLQTPHLTGYFVCLRGRFVLEPLPGNRTRIIGTSWYQNHMAPVWYWRLWCDHIVHTVHLRVFSHIRRLAEADAALQRLTTPNPSPPLLPYPPTPARDFQLLAPPRTR